IAVAPAHRRYLGEMSAVLGRAFYDDPVMAWMLPDGTIREHALKRMFATMIRHHFLRTGGTEVASGGHVGAAALWDPPGQWRHTRREELFMIPGFVRAFGGQVRRGQQVADLMKEKHPNAPHWYLAVIGSDPTVRGAGYG